MIQCQMHHNALGMYDKSSLNKPSPATKDCESLNSSRQFPYMVDAQYHRCETPSITSDMKIFDLTDLIWQGFQILQPWNWNSTRDLLQWQHKLFLISYSHNFLTRTNKPGFFFFLLLHNLCCTISPLE